MCVNIKKVVLGMILLFCVCGLKAEPFRKIIAGDRLRIDVAEQRDLSKDYAVAGDGTIDFAFLGRVEIVDMSVDEAAGRIEELLEQQYFREANVSVKISEFVEGDLLVMGAVKRPGIIPFKSDEIMTLLEVILRCGGLRDDASGSEVTILRSKPNEGMERQMIKVDVQSMIDNFDFSNDQYVRPRDIIVVPTLGSREGVQEFLALGEVQRPGFHAYSENLDVLRAIPKIGGFSAHANWRAARILRSNQGGKYTVLPVDLSRLLGEADISMNIPLMPGDIFFVPSKEQSSRGEVYLLGEVNSRGAISLPINKEKTLAKTLLSVGGVGKYGNAEKVKILRRSPSGEKQSLIVDVEEILETGAFEDDVPLEDGDVIIVPEKIWGF